ncbi:hypothetical protein SEA_SHAM_184 [Streptomyces phage Sham]|nr:hypothetical protein SEA_SHAM_184 [Streptomyces phage Sham]
MLELLLIAWLAGAVVVFLSCSAWLYTSFTRGGFFDGLMILCFVVILAIFFIPLSILGFVIMLSDKIRGKRV